MDKWLEIPKDRTGLPVGRLCLILALTILILMAHSGRAPGKLSEMGAFGLGSAVVGLA